MRWYRKLHWQIIIGLVLGLAFGVTAAMAGWTGFVDRWVAPIGTIFVNLLKLVAIPLVLTSLTVGICSLADLRKLSRMGGKTIVFYVVTTAVAITIGLTLVNTLRPGDRIPTEVREELKAKYQKEADSKTLAVEEVKSRGPLQPLVDMVPSNFFKAIGSNQNMLQVVFLALLFGIALVRLPKEQAQPVLNLLQSLNHLVIRVVHLVMKVAPIGVFALLAGTITTLSSESAGSLLKLLSALGFYCTVVVLGLLIQVLLVYPTLLKLFTSLSYGEFFSGIGPAQLVAFSTSSSGATLPVTMEQCEERLGVSEEVSSFVLPLGATINMDGTALYQSVAAVFIAQALMATLTVMDQLSILFTALLASVGAAAVPGAGIIMLVIILQQLGVPVAGIALILGVDRILDMLRTTTNVTGDATAASVIAATEGQLKSQEAIAEAGYA